MHLLRPSSCVAYLVVTICCNSVARSQDCRGPGDIVGSTTVDLEDLVAFDVCLSGPGEDVRPTCFADKAAAADVDADGDVDLRDYSHFAVAFGRSYFDYRPTRENDEAERLAMHVTGEWRAPDEAYQRIVRDLQLIRSLYASLAMWFDRPAYHHRHLFVRLTEGINADAALGLIDYLLLEEVRCYFGGLCLLVACDDLNMLAIADELGGYPGVEVAGPDWAGVIDGSCLPDIRLSDRGAIYRYEFIYGTDGNINSCDCAQKRTIDVTKAGEVQAVDCVDTCTDERQ